MERGQLVISDERLLHTSPLAASFPWFKIINCKWFESYFEYNWFQRIENRIKHHPIYLFWISFLIAPFRKSRKSRGSALWWAGPPCSRDAARSSSCTDHCDRWAGVSGQAEANQLRAQPATSPSTRARGPGHNRGTDRGSIRPPCLERRESASQAASQRSIAAYLSACLATGLDDWRHRDLFPRLGIC